MNASLAAAGPVAQGSAFGAFLALAFVIAIILVLAWALRRIQGGAMRNGGAIRVVASASLGMKERLVLVDVGGEQFLLGVTVARIELLQRLETPVELAEQQSSFLQILARHGGIGRT